MHKHPLLTSAAVGAALVMAFVAGPTPATAASLPATSPAATPATATSLPATSPAATFPQDTAARLGASWLARQLTPAGYLPSATTPGQPDLVATANT
ncbi:MAG: hypothetical protein ACRDYE_09785, partial [Acidimicrobiales bacterium]